MANPEKLPEELLEEYKVCNDRSIALGDLVWKSAGLLGIGSFAGLIYASGFVGSESTHKTYFVPLLSLFAIVLIVSWKRMALRWYSVSNALIRRMEHIEEDSQMRATLYTAYLDFLKEGKPSNFRVPFESRSTENTITKKYIIEPYDKDLEGMKPSHQRGGLIEPISLMVDFNIAAWGVVGLLAFFMPKITICARYKISAMLWPVAILLLLVFFLIDWAIRWRRP